MDAEQTKYICGFWRRLGALFIDALVLGGFGLLLGLFLEGVFATLGPWGRLVGFTIAGVYFGLMNSELAGGQTLGKRALGIRVVGTDGLAIGVGRSLLRFSILGIPYFLNGAQFDLSSAAQWLTIVLGLVVFGVLSASAYLLVCNRVTRQTLHDLVLRTYVVHASAAPQPVQPMWAPHWIAVAMLFATAGVLPVYLLKWADATPFAGLLARQQALMQNPEVRYAAVNAGRSTFTGNSGTSSHTFFTAEVYLREKRSPDEAFARQLAVSALTSDAADEDVFQIILIYGYDIGIATQFHSRAYEFKPEELRSAPPGD